MTARANFVKQLDGFVDDLKQVINTQGPEGNRVSRDIHQLGLLVEAGKVNSRKVCDEFNKYLLREELVRAVMRSDGDYFESYVLDVDNDPSTKHLSPEYKKNALDAISRFQTLFRNIHGENRVMLFRWMKAIYYFAALHQFKEDSEQTKQFLTEQQNF